MRSGTSSTGVYNETVGRCMSVFTNPWSYNDRWDEMDYKVATRGEIAFAVMMGIAVILVVLVIII